MKISVILPIYGLSKIANGDIVYSFETLLHQTLSRNMYEIIAVDDNSSDNTMEILEKYERNYPDNFHAVHSNTNLRAGGARNLGFNAAKGEYITFVDQDDWVSQDYLEVLLKKIEETGADAVGCNFCNKRNKNQIVENNKINESYHGLPSGVLNHDQKAKMFLDSGHVMEKLYRRELLDQCVDENGKLFPEKLRFEDNAKMGDIVLHINHFEYIDSAMYFYYENVDSVSRSVSQGALDDRLQASRIMLSLARKNGYFDEFRDEIEYQFVKIFLVNTIFGIILPQLPDKNLQKRYINQIMEECVHIFPDFEKNHYYQERTYKFQKYLISHLKKSYGEFIFLYHLHNVYHDIRYGKEK